MRLVFATLFLFAAGFLPAQDEAEVTRLLKVLQGRDLQAQSEAIRSIATSLDPRIPDACLPLLQSLGTSVRRNAARAIGSRWHQIPKERIATFVQSLKANLDAGDQGLVNMSRRGVALLNRTYDNDMFSRSRSKRWVVYERRGKPCLIDTKNHSEELLGFGVEGQFSPSFGNEEITRSCFWHPKQDMVALETIIFRHTAEVWVWRHPKGLRPITKDELLDLLKPAKGVIKPEGGFYVRVGSWKGNALDLVVNYTIKDNEEFIERQARVRWDSENDLLSVLSD